MRRAPVLIFAQNLANIRRRKLIQLLIMTENNHGYVDGAQHGQFMSLLEKAPLSFQKCHRTVSVIFDGLDLDFAPTHCEGVQAASRSDPRDKKITSTRQPIWNVESFYRLNLQIVNTCDVVAETKISTTKKIWTRNHAAHKAEFGRPMKN